MLVTHKVAILRIDTTQTAMQRQRTTLQADIEVDQDSNLCFLWISIRI